MIHTYVVKDKRKKEDNIDSHIRCNVMPLMLQDTWCNFRLRNLLSM